MPDPSLEHTCLSCHRVDEGPNATCDCMESGDPCGICAEPEYEPLTPWKSNSHWAEDGHEWVPVEAHLEKARSRIVQSMSVALNLDAKDFKNNSEYQVAKAEALRAINQTIRTEFAAIRADVEARHSGLAEAAHKALDLLDSAGVRGVGYATAAGEAGVILDRALDAESKQQSIV